MRTVRIFLTQTSRTDLKNCKRSTIFLIRSTSLSKKNADGPHFFTPISQVFLENYKPSAILFICSTNSSKKIADGTQFSYLNQSN